MKIYIQNKPEVEENLKENLRNKDRTHQNPIAVDTNRRQLESAGAEESPREMPAPEGASLATVLGLYSHIAHLVDKEEGEIPPPD